MKTFATLTAAGALLAAVIGTADAADLLSTKDAPNSSSSSWINWSGAYASIGLGGVFTSADAVGTGKIGYNTIFGGGDAAVSGFYGDLRLGYDRALGNGLLVGVWADISDNVASGSTSCPHPCMGSKAESQYGYGAGIRVGRYFGTGLVYAITGWQAQHVKDSNSLFSFSNDLNGWLVGGGIEEEVFPHVFLGAEADYVAYGDWTPLKGVTVGADEIRAMARISYRFNNGY